MMDGDRYIGTVGELRKAIRSAPVVVVNSHSLWGVALAVSKAEVLRAFDGVDGDTLLDTEALVFGDGAVSI